MKRITKHIVVEPNVRFGKPIIQGTRVPVTLVIGKIAGGMTLEEVMREYDLTRAQVQAALEYAAKVVDEEEISIV